MVSFHCDACTDVVKKPKLDRHYGQCRSSFTCIDCSKTFQGPAQWKAHTSCVTEAEKYQKSLYEGPKNGSRPANGRRTDFTPKTMNASGKYRQSLSTQSGWLRHQTIRNCASGANSTPLGSPLRMSPVDTSAVEPSLSTANATSMTEGGEGTKGDSGAAVMSYTSNEAELKEKKKKRKHDTPRGHNGKHATADELPAKVNGSSEKCKGGEKSGDESQSKTQPPTDGIPRNSEDKKVKKRKKEKREEARSKEGNADEENIGPPEAVAPHGGKKRKHKEDVQANQGEGKEVDQTSGEKRKRKKKLDS